MPKDADQQFYKLADAHINLSNSQIGDNAERGNVSASMMYATARFNAWLRAAGCHTGAELAGVRQQTIDYFVKDYRAMLEENLDDYIKNFDIYMQIKPPQSGS